MRSTHLRQDLTAASAIMAAILTQADTAHAYLDPGTASLLLQGIIGGIAAGLVVIKLYWTKLKALFGSRRDGDPPVDTTTRHMDKSAG